MATKWNLDTAHSEITFKVRHMMISNVKGAFNTFTAEVEAEDDTFKNAKVSATIQTDSIDTNNADRDTHLKSADFFNAEQNPTITFKSVSLADDVTGHLTINGVTKPVQLEVEFGGINQDHWGNTKDGFTLKYSNNYH